MSSSPVKTVDYQNTRMKKFPSTSKMAETQWSEYLQKEHEEGWELRAITPYNLGVEIRYMLIFYRHNQGVTPTPATPKPTAKTVK